MACGEGYGTDVLAAARAPRDRRGRQPGGPRARPRASTPPRRALRARPDRDLHRALRRRGVPADDRARQGAASGAQPLQGDGADDRLRLDPQPAHAGPARRRQVGQPLAPARVPGRRSSASCARASSTGSSCSASSTPASSGRTSWRCAPAGTACTPRCGITRPFYDRFTPAISARDFALRPGPLDRALDFVAVLR